MSLAITQLDDQPFHRMRALNARRGGGRESVAIPFLRGRLNGLPPELDALIFTGDLQGVASRENEELVLCGILVADELAELSAAGELPPLEKTGVILTGDLFSVPDASKRGGFGDVTEVWRAFHRIARWVTGVAGNHDDVSRVHRSGGTLLDVSATSLDGLRIGGVGLICGDPAKPGRRAQEDQLAAIELITADPLDVLVLHEGPCGSHAQRGNEAIQPAAPIVACGHVHWEEPLFRHAYGAVLNVDGRVVVLTR